MTMKVTFQTRQCSVDVWQCVTRNGFRTGGVIGLMFHLPDPVYRICGWLALFYRFAFRAALCVEPTARDEGKLKTRKKGTNKKQRCTNKKSTSLAIGSFSGRFLVQQTRKSSQT